MNHSTAQSLSRLSRPKGVQCVPLYIPLLNTGDIREKHFALLRAATSATENEDKTMNYEEQKTIETAINRDIDEAIAAMPDATDVELTEWMMNHTTPEIMAFMAMEGLKEVVHERARKMGVTLSE